jgi:hypothetical protein
MAKTTRTRKKVSTSPPATITVQSRVLRRVEGGEDEETVLVDEVEEIEVQVFHSEPAYIEASAGVTKSLRQFESLRVDVRMRLPCYVERADEAFDYAAGWVSDRLYDEVDNYFNGEGDDGETDT